MDDEIFTPEDVDEQIDRQIFLLWKEQAGQPGASIVQRLHALYEEDLYSTAHVWERLVLQAGERDLAERQRERLPALSQERTLLEVPRGAHPSRRQKRQSSSTGQTPFGRRVSLLVAVLAMIVFVGSLVVVLHEIRLNLPAGTGGTTPGQTVYSMAGGPEAPLFVDLAWSPDSRRVAASGINRVQIWDARTGANLVNVHLPADMLSGSHATSFSCASRGRMRVPCRRKRRQRPSGKCG